MTGPNSIKNAGAGRGLVLLSIVGVRVGVAPYRNKLELQKKPKNLHAISQHSSFYIFRDLSVHTDKRKDGQ